MKFYIADFGSRTLSAISNEAESLETTTTTVPGEASMMHVLKEAYGSEASEIPMTKKEILEYLEIFSTATPTNLQDSK